MLRVLLVEDNPGDAELVRIRLRESPGEAYDVVVASTLAEGVLELERSPPEVVLLDLNLSDSDGLETLRVVRATNEVMPIVVLTGTDDLDTAVEALRDGADDYIAKSEIVRPGLVRRALRYGVERRRSLTALRIAVRAREELLQIVSHDLRNHVGTIDLAARLARKARSPEEVLRRVGAIERASATSLRLLDDLVDLAALEKGGLAVNVAEIDLGPLVRDVHIAFLPTAEHRGVRLELDVVAGQLAAWGDSVRVTQVLGNLLGNALKFTPSGGTISLGVRATDDALTLYVRDTGSGISAEDKGRLFERFFRGSNPSGKGAGLGLAISRALVEAQGGNIWVESTEGQGSTFFFSLQRCAPATTIAANPTAV